MNTEWVSDSYDVFRRRIKFGDCMFKIDCISVPKIKLIPFFQKYLMHYNNQIYHIEYTSLCIVQDVGEYIYTGNRKWMIMSHKETIDFINNFKDTVKSAIRHKLIIAKTYKICYNDTDSIKYIN